jgi:gliding motility-associated-like protein
MTMIKKLLFALLAVALSSQVVRAQLSATISNQKDACDGLFNGSFDVTIDPPGTTGPYAIFVFGLGFGQTVAAATPSVGVPVPITGLRPDTYLVNVGDNDGSTPNFNTFIAIATVAPDLNVTIDAVIDNTDCSAPDGQISITVTGGTGNYSYKWTGPGAFNSTLEDISGLPGGSYSLVVSDDGTNCTRSPSPINVNDPSPAIQNISTSSPLIVCAGSDAQITLGASEPSPVTYQVLVNGSPVGSPQNNPAAPGPFTLTVPSASFSNGDVLSVQGADGSCTAILMNGSVIINIPPLPTVSNVTGGGTVCQGSPLPNITFAFTGSAPFNFTYTDGTTNFPVANHPTNSFTISNAPAGTYQVISLQDANGCFATALGSTASVIVNPLPVPTITGQASVCAGSSEVYSTESGGGENNYMWTVQGGTVTSGGTATDGSVTVLWDGVAPFSVSVSYTDGNGCTAAAPTTQNITVNPLPVPTLTGPLTSCFNDSQVYTTDSGGGQSNYVWAVQGGTIIAGGTSTDATATIQWDGAAPYNVSVNYADVNGCTAASPTIQTITINPLPVPSLTGAATTCFGGSEIYNTDSGAGETNYVWTVQGGTVTSGGTATDGSVTVLWDGATPYSVSVSYTDANGCTAAAPTLLPISFFPPPVPTITGSVNVCDGSIENYTTESGGGESNYVWAIQGGTITAGGTVTDAFVTVQWNGVAPYSVSVGYNDANGCGPASPTTQVITVNPLPVPTLTGPATSCFGSDETYNTDTGGGESNYNWIVQGGTITAGGTSTDASVTVNWDGAAPNTVSISYTDGNGCTAASPTVVNVTVDPAPVADAGPPQTICAGDDATLAGTVGGSAVSGSWMTAGDGSFDDATSLGAVYTPGANDIASGSVTLTLTSDATASCPSVSDNVTITITPPPTTADAGPDKTVCGNTNLEGNVPVVGTGTWSIISGAGGSVTDVNDPASAFSGVSGQVYVLEWTISTCASSTDQVQITFDANTPTVSNAGGDQLICSTVSTSATLMANAPLVGTGSWSIISGAGGSFADATSPGTLFTGNAGEIYVLRWTITSTCGSSTDDMMVTFELDPSVADAGSDILDCGPSTTLGAVPPASGTGQWSMISGAGGAFVDVLNPSTDFSGTAGTTYVLRWTVSNSCGSTSDDVSVTFETLPSIADAGSDKTVCGMTNLEGNTPAVGTGAWTIISGAGGVITDPADPISSFAGVAATTYTLQWTITNGSCPPSADQVDITFDPNSPTPSNAGPDQQICGANAILAANNPALGTGQWTVVSGAGGSFIDDTDPTTTFNGTPGVAYTLRWTITTACGTAVDDVDVILDENPTVADAGPDQAICGPATMAANTPLVGTGTWTIVSGSGGILADANDPGTVFQGAAGTTYTLAWTISNGSCAPSVDQVDIAFDANTPTIADAGTDQNICDVTTTLAGNTPVVGTGQWTIISGAGGSFADDTDPASIFNGVAGTAYLLRWTISNGGGCTPSTDDVSVAFDTPPSIADAGPDQQVCSNTVTLAANTPVTGTGLWNVISGAGGSFVDNANPATDFSGAAGTTYMLRWTISNACGSNTDDVQIMLDQPPTAADAGSDKTVCGPTNLEGNTPAVGTGIWMIISGAGGVLANVNDPASLFSGTGGTTYTLQWTTSNGTCPSSSDQVDITFDVNTPTIADAGADQSVCDVTTTLAGNTPVVGTGQWSIVSGAGGSFVDDLDPATTFNGNAGATYVLRWTISNGGACSPSQDDVTIVFEVAPTASDAGADQEVCGGTATLAANTPVSGSGVWAVISGAGGSFVDDTNPSTDFNGTAGVAYVLRWTISNSCGSVSDDVNIQLDGTPTAADAGPDQVVCGSTLTSLAGNAPGGGNNGLWIVISGSGGAPLTPNSPTSQFTGTAGTSYTLRWIISNGGVCPPSTDDVVINFASAPLVSSPLDACINSPAPTLQATATGATSINWFTDAALTNLVFTGSNYVPGPAELNMSVTGTTTFYVTATYACGTSAASQFVVNVVNTPGCVGGGTDCFAFTILVVNAETQRPSCSDQDDGIITLDVSGVTPGNFIVQLISPADTLTQVGPAGVYKFINLSAASYSYRVTDAVGNVCQQPYDLPLRTVVQAVASNPVDALCYGDPSGKVTLTITGGNSPYEYSVDGTTWVQGLISGGEISGLPPNGTYPILVRDDDTDLCPAEVMITIDSINPQIQATFNVTSATCGGGDGAIAVASTSGGSGSGYEYSINGGAFGPGPFASLNGGMYTITVRDAIGCTQNLDVAVTFPGFVNHSISATDADCNNNGMSGTITVSIADAGVFSVALSTDQFNEPNDTAYQNYTAPSITFNNLGRGTYYVYLKSTGASCPTRSVPIVINGTYAINFDFEPVCDGLDLSLSLINITGEPGIPIEIQVFKKFTNVMVESIPVSSIPPTNSYRIEYASHPWLQSPGEYQIQIVQVQSTFCLLSSPLMDYAVSVPLFAAIGETTKSYPDITNGSMQIINFSGPGPDYMTTIRLDSAAVPGQAYDSGPDIVPTNLQGNFEILYKNIPAGRYEVIVTDMNGCSRVLVGRVPLDTEIFIPNVFTPNDDGVNDVFFIRNLPDTNAELIISNRWGAEVYSTRSYQNNWDGSGVSDGVYFYRLSISGGDARTGWIEIVRGMKP